MSYQSATLDYFTPLSLDQVDHDNGQLRRVVQNSLRWGSAVGEYTPPDEAALVFSRYRTKIRAMQFDNSLLPENTDAPSENAIFWTTMMLQQLQKDKVIPDTVVASVEGGVAICFTNGNKYSEIECLNNGVILAVTSDRRNRPFAWEVEQSPSDIARTSVRIREFVRS